MKGIVTNFSGKYVEREFASLDQEVEKMESSCATFCGPKGSGKSTTLQYYHVGKIPFL